MRSLRVFEVEGNRSIGLGWAHTAGEIDEASAEASAGAFAVWGSGCWLGSRHTELHTAQDCYLSVEAPDRIRLDTAHLNTQLTGKRRN